MPNAAPAKSRKEVKAEVRKHLRTSAAEHLKFQLALTSTGFDEDQARDVGAGQQPGGRPADAPPAPSSFERPIMTVGQFLAGNYLEPGDVVLMTRLGSFFAWLLKAFN